MGDHRSYGAIALGILLFVGATAARAILGKEFEIKPTDLILLTLPALLWLVASGQIQKFKLGTSGLEVQSAFQRAVRSPIGRQIQELPISTLTMAGKEGLDALEAIASSGPQALILKKRNDNWYNEDALEQYIKRLSKTEGFKLFIFEDVRGRFIGAIAGNHLVRALSIGEWERYMPNAGAGNHLINFTTLVAIMNNRTDESTLLTTKGFLSQDDALPRNADKKTALTRMEEKNTSWLPVVDRRTKKLLGVVEQPRLAASLILDITRSLEATGGGS
jgi:hypothetical protein